MSMAAGLAVMPGALSLHEQHRIVADALGLWPAPPNRTNHSVHLGGLPGLWDASQTVGPLAPMRVPDLYVDGLGHAM